MVVVIVNVDLEAWVLATVPAHVFVKTALGTALTIVVHHAE
jgi:hypothetical protein